MLAAASARDAVSAGVHVETVVTVRGRIPALNALAADAHDAVLAVLKVFLLGLLVSCS